MEKENNIIRSRIATNIISQFIKDKQYNKCADLFAGTGNTVANILENGIDIKNIYLQDIRNGLETDLGNFNKQNIKYIIGDSITNPVVKRENSVDLVVSEIPLGFKYENFIYKKEKFIYGVPKNFIDYCCIQRVIEALNERGQAYIITSLRVLFSTGEEKNIREKIIKDDLIECVVKLPNNLYFPTTTMQTCLLILNKNKESERKGKIQFINAENLITIEKNKNEVYANQEEIIKVSEIYKKYIKNSSIVIDIENLKDYDYSLNIWDLYELDKIKNEIKNYILLRDVSELKRGVQIDSQKLKEAKEGKNRTHYYINIVDIDKETSQIKYNEENLVEPTNRWIASAETKFNDLIINMLGDDLKIGIVEDTMKMGIVSGNLIIIRLNNNYNSYVLKTYLESEKGKKILNLIKKGSSISRISIDDLKNLPIPNLELDKQEKIEKKIKENKRKYEEEKKRIEEDYKKSLKKIYDDMNI